MLYDNAVETVDQSNVNEDTEAPEQDSDVGVLQKQVMVLQDSIDDQELRVPPQSERTRHSYIVPQFNPVIVTLLVVEVVFIVQIESSNSL